MTKLVAYLIEPMDRISGQLVIGATIDRADVVVFFEDGTQTVFNATELVTVARPAGE
jgi:hypothetical protein